MNLDGNVTHKVKRSLELKPEIIKLENKKKRSEEELILL